MTTDERIDVIAMRLTDGAIQAMDAVNRLTNIAGAREERLERQQ
jgi:hypothetical protein